MGFFMAIIKAVVFFWLCTGIAFANAADLSSKLKASAQHHFKGGHSPGLSVAVVQDGRILLMEGMGSADIENDVPATTKTVYRIGSLTKQFTAAAIMKLASENKLKLDDVISNYLSETPKQWGEVTVRNLLNHTSGIPSYTSMEAFAKQYRLDLSHEQLLEMIRHEKVDFKPNEKWAYSNSGYYLLGLVIENVTRKTYEQYLTEVFFEPLGMESSFYCDHKKIIKHRSAGYEKMEGKWINADILSMNSPFAAGALCSTAEDLAKWSMALAGGKVIPLESYRQMITPEKLIDGTPLPYGFGLGVGELLGYKQIGHGGGINGFITRNSYYPERKLHIVVLTNSGSGEASKLTAELAKAVLTWNGK